jgi:hypothetical protein
MATFLADDTEHFVDEFFMLANISDNYVFSDGGCDVRELRS